jgi:hypothetical protein
VIITIALIDPYYRVNDDIEMNMIASGYLDGSPSEFLVFMNIMIGVVLKWLYELPVSFDWYPAFMTICLYYSMVLTSLVFVDLAGRNRGLLMYILFYAGVYFYFLVRQEFTITSLLMIGIGGYYLFNFGAKEDRVHLRVLGAISIVVGSLLRLETLVLLILVFGWRLGARFRWRFPRVLIGNTVAILGIIAMLWSIHVYVYRNYHGDSSEYIETRAMLVDRPISAAGVNFEKEGISRNDIAMVELLIPFDLSRLNSQWMEEAHSVVSTTRTGNQLIGYLVNIVLNSKFVIFQLFLIVSFVIICTQSSFRELLRAKATTPVLFFVVILVILSVWRKVPDYIVNPVLVLICLTIIYSVLERAKAERTFDSLWRARLCAVVFMAVVVTSGVWIGIILDKNSQRQLYHSEYLSEIAAANAKILVLGPLGLKYKMHDYPVFSSLRPQSTMKLIVPGGWPLGAPTIWDALMKINEGDLLKYSLDRSDVLYIGVDTVSIRAYFAEHYSENIRFLHIPSDLGLIKYRIQSN